MARNETPPPLAFFIFVVLWALCFTCLVRLSLIAEFSVIKSSVSLITLLPYRLFLVWRGLGGCYSAYQADPSCVFRPEYPCTRSRILLAGWYRHGRADAMRLKKSSNCAYPSPSAESYLRLTMTTMVISDETDYTRP